MKIQGQFVDLNKNQIYPAEIIFGKKITQIRKIKSAPKRFILPGFIDGHIHTESSMLIPSEFAKLAVCHGTVAVIADPHEIANVLGIKGIEFMIKNSKKVPLRFYFGASSCVPATCYETSGAKLGEKEIEKLLRKKEITHLAEMMNYPGVINKDPSVMKKIKLAKKYKKKIDGHAPGLRGEDLDAYLKAGIETDHECYSLKEAREKMKKGMKIIVREGSAAKNLSALYPVLKKGENFLCVDDLHPDDLMEGHLDILLRKCIALGIKPMDAISCCTKNPAKHYGIGGGILEIGERADITVVSDLKKFKVLETWIDGEKVFSKTTKFTSLKESPINKFNAREISPKDLECEKPQYIIGAADGNLITEKIRAKKTENDVLKIIVINRYKKTKPAVGFIKNFGLKKGAFGASVMHDSHNIGVIGVDDESICKVANEIIKLKGGLVVYDGRLHSLPLPFAGIMSNEKGEVVARKYKKLSRLVKKLGCKMKAPFMTLSFMGLLVIPHLKISDKGLFDADKFCFV